MLRRLPLPLLWLMPIVAWSSFLARRFADSLTGISEGALFWVAVVATLPLVARRRLDRPEVGGWVSDLVGHERRKAAGMGDVAWLRRRLVMEARLLLIRAATPSSFSLWVVATITLLFGLALLLLSRSLASAQGSEAFLALWQVQSAVGGVALPILVFVIELARDDVGAARRTAEVLIRHTLVFPIIALVLGLSLAFGAGAQWPRSAWTYPLGLLLHAVTVALVVIAVTASLAAAVFRPFFRVNARDIDRPAGKAESPTRCSGRT